MSEFWIKARYKGVDLGDSYKVSNLGRVYSIKYSKILKPFNNHGYFIITIRRKKVRVHRLVYESFHGKILDKKVIHHIDGNGLNNNIDNLKALTHRENSSIEKVIKSGLPVGVRSCYGGLSYQSRIKVGTLSIFLGTYDTPELASKAYHVALSIIVADRTIEKKKLQNKISDYRETIGLKRIRHKTL